MIQNPYHRPPLFLSCLHPSYAVASCLHQIYVGVCICTKSRRNLITQGRFWEGSLDLGQKRVGPSLEKRSQKRRQRCYVCYVCIQRILTYIHIMNLVSIRDVTFVVIILRQRNHESCSSLSPLPSFRREKRIVCMDSFYKPEDKTYQHEEFRHPDVICRIPGGPRKGRNAFSRIDCKMVG